MAAKGRQFKVGVSLQDKRQIQMPTKGVAEPNFLPVPNLALRSFAHSFWFFGFRLSWSGASPTFFCGVFCRAADLNYAAD